MKKPITIDFETEAIQRPKAPAPVGVAILEPGKKPRYLAWGHPTGNNTTQEKARTILKDIWTGDRPLLFHNAKFDLDVAEQHLGLALPPWDRVHDTLFTLFLRNPHARSLSLKPSAVEYLGMAPEEQNAVFDWLAEHGIIQRPRKKNGVLAYPPGAGAYISKAPAGLVGEYAIGDVVRTAKLFEQVQPEIYEMGMRVAYDRERRLLPLLLRNERQGMRVDLPALERDLVLYEAALRKADRWLRKTLGAPGLNLDADEDVAKALKTSGQVEKFPQTPTGRDSISKKNLTVGYFKDRKVWLALYYRNALATVLSMSMRNWFEQGSQNGGYIYTEWNQVRQGHGADKFKGARSGRITCSYFQNISKTFLDRGDGYEHPRFLGVPELPLVRKYLLPDDGDLFVHRDYNQQELRLVAHYEGGALASAYQNDPSTDVHQYVRDLIEKVTGRSYERRPVKIVNFRTVYGGGIGGLAESLGIPYKEAALLVGSWRKALPDVVDLDGRAKDRFRQGNYIRTFGGRVYYCKPPAIAKKGPQKGREISFEYTALNYLIQPSGADVTKEAIIRYHDHPKRKGRLLVTVHDEINLSVGKKLAKQESQVLKECMESITLKVPWMSEGKVGTTWGNLAKEA